MRGLMRRAKECYEINAHILGVAIDIWDVGYLLVSLGVGEVHALDEMHLRDVNLPAQKRSVPALSEFVNLSHCLSGSSVRISHMSLIVYQVRALLFLGGIGRRIGSDRQPSRFESF